MSSALKVQLATTSLGLWAHVHNFYKKFKKNDSFKYGTIAVVLVIMLVLILLRGDAGKKDTLGFDPFELLGVERTANRRDIQRVFRDISRTKHPDVDKSEGAADRYLKYQLARDILVDENKRANYEKFGTPEPPTSLFDIETYPDWIRYPGKKFVAFYLLLAAAALVIPLGVVFLSPALREPPAWIYNYIFDQIEAAESLLAANDDARAMSQLDAIYDTWKQLCGKFKKYSNTKYAAIFATRVQARKALAQVYANNVSEALSILSEVKKQYKHELTSAAVYAHTKHAVNDLKNAFAQVTLNKLQKREVDEMLSFFSK